MAMRHHLFNQMVVKTNVNRKNVRAQCLSRRLNAAKNNAELF